MSQELKVIYSQLMEKIAKSEDVKVTQLFVEDRVPMKSPMDKDRRRTEFVELEEIYLNVRHARLSLVDCPCMVIFIQCFDTVGWVTGRTSSP